MQDMLCLCKVVAQLWPSSHERAAMQAPLDRSHGGGLPAVAFGTAVNLPRRSKVANCKHKAGVDLAANCCGFKRCTAGIWLLGS
jgi:hypothetical protein